MWPIIYQRMGISLKKQTYYLTYLEQLPEYMIPSVLVHMDKLPLTINGKLDRKALPDPILGSDTESYTAPRNDLETRLCTIFAEVLGLEVSKVGINDTFFKLGGNSILAIKLVNKIRKETSLLPSIADMFSHKNIKNLSHHLQTNTRENIIIPLSKMAKSEDQLLSFAQERLYFIDKYEQGTNAYNIPIVCKLDSDIDIHSLTNAIHSVVKRHDVLRTYIQEDGKGSSYQIINKFQNKYFKKSKVKDIEELDKLIAQNVNYVFNLSEEYPLKVRLYQQRDSKESYISIVIHHIAFDGWSIDVFLNEVQQYYSHYKESTKLDLPDLSIQYKDFALWQKSYLTGEVLANQLNYWKKQLDSYENINLLTDYPRPLKLDYKGNNISFSLDKKLSKALRDTAKRLGVSLYTLLLSCYYLMLRSYTNQNDIVIGTPIANRNYPQVQHLIGLFVNTLALRINMHNSFKLTEFIKELGEQVIEAQMHQDLPFEKLVDELNVEKDLSRHPIFQVMFGLQSFGSQSFEHRGSNENEKSILSPYSTEETSYNIAKFDLETFINDGEDELRGSFNYRVSLYNKNTIKGFINTYIRILEQVAALNDNSTIQDLKYLDKQDENLILRKWNATDKSYPRDKTVHALFEEQVLKTS